jgi:hypothetical protein
MSVTLDRLMAGETMAVLDAGAHGGSVGRLLVGDGARKLLWRLLTWEQ